MRLSFLSSLRDSTDSLLCRRSQSEPDAADVKRASQLEKTISSLSGDLEALRTKASKFSDAIAALEDKIREVGGIKFRTAEAKVSDLQDQIRLTDSRLVKAKTEKAKAEKDLVKLSKAIETNTAKSDELDAEISELKEQLAEKEAEAEPVRQTVEEAQAKVEEGREELANLKAELEEQEEAIIEFRKAEVRSLLLTSLLFSSCTDLPRLRRLTSKVSSPTSTASTRRRPASSSTGQPRLESFRCPNLTCSSSSLLTASEC